MTTYDQDTSMLIAYIDARYFEPQSKWEDYWLRMRSYELWATDDILKSIYDHPFVDPREIIRGFIDRMELWLDIINDNTDQTYMFSVAKETAEDLLKFLK